MHGPHALARWGWRRHEGSGRTVTHLLRDIRDPCAMVRVTTVVLRRWPVIPCRREKSVWRPASTVADMGSVASGRMWDSCRGGAPRTNTAQADRSGGPCG